MRRGARRWETLRRDGLSACTAGADLATARAVHPVDLQRRAEPRLRQLDHPPSGLLPAALDDADLRGVLGLGFGASRDRLRMVLRDPGVPDRPRRVRPGSPGARGAGVGLSEIAGG